MSRQKSFIDIDWRSMGIRELVCNTLYTWWKYCAHRSIKLGFHGLNCPLSRKGKSDKNMETRASDSLQKNMVLAMRQSGERWRLQNL